MVELSEYCRVKILGDGEKKILKKILEKILPKLSDDGIRQLDVMIYTYGWKDRDFGGYWNE